MARPRYIASLTFNAIFLLVHVVKGSPFFRATGSAVFPGSDNFRGGSISTNGVTGKRTRRDSKVEDDLSSSMILVNRSPTLAKNGGIRVAYQGEPGAYSEKATRELLGSNVVAIGRQNFEDCYRAVVSREVDYCCLPIENTLGGSIHDNYDLMLRYDLHIVAEHEFRVAHCMLVKPGVKREQIKYAISHPQALAQCDNYLRRYGITPIKAYDTSGSAKMLSKPDFEKICPSIKGTVPDDAPPMTAENTCAIASDLAGRTYGLDCMAEHIEDDDSNFTRFLLLGRNGVQQYLTRGIPAKTSVVFTLPDSPGALYKALACFSLRDIDFSKIESRPTSASLLSFLKYQVQAMDKSGKWGTSKSSKTGLPRFKYCFYLDFLANELDEDAQNALHHLREQADFCRVLGSYPQKSKLVGPVKDEADAMKLISPPLPMDQVSLTNLPSDSSEELKLKIGIIGFGDFGQFLAKKIMSTTNHKISCIDKVDKSKQAQEMNAEFYPIFNMLEFIEDLDVVVLSVPLVELEEVVSHLPKDTLHKKLWVEVCPLNVHPKTVLLANLPPDADIICSHPMFGSKSTLGGGGSGDKNKDVSWDNLPFVYEKVRVQGSPKRAEAFLDIFSKSRCKMIEMSAEQHDRYTANAEFVTQLTGRLLNSKSLLPPSPILSREYELLRDVVSMTSSRTSFDVFYGMFKFNHENARKQLDEMRDKLAKIERDLAAKEAYLAAKSEIQNDDRQKLIAECKLLLSAIATEGKNTAVKETLENGTEKQS